MVIEKQSSTTVTAKRKSLTKRRVIYILHTTVFRDGGTCQTSTGDRTPGISKTGYRRPLRRLKQELLDTSTSDFCPVSHW